MRVGLGAIACIMSLAALLPAGARAQGNPDWHRAIPGFKIAGNLYYVGTADLAAYLIATPQGNILINGNFKEDVPVLLILISATAAPAWRRPRCPRD